MQTYLSFSIFYRKMFYFDLGNLLLQQNTKWRNMYKSFEHICTYIQSYFCKILYILCLVIYVCYYLFTHFMSHP